MRDNLALCGSHLLVDYVLLAKLIIDLLSLSHVLHAECSMVGVGGCAITRADGGGGHDFNYILN